MTRARIVLLALAVFAVASSAWADVAFPARLTVEETEPGSYDVTFTLPIVEGRKLRAEPLLPPTCHEVTERVVGVSSAGHTTTWTVVCDPPSLAGDAVLIEGLLGTQTDLAFTLTTLDGRRYSEILRPSRPGFLVPLPPSPAELGGLAMIEGVRRVVRQLPLWLLMVVVVTAGEKWRGVVAGAVGLAIAHGLAQWLGGNGWLVVPALVRDGFVLVSAAVPSVGLAGGGERWRGWLEPLWPLMVLLGLLFGGAQAEGLPSDGLSTVEQLMAMVLFAVGTGVGLLLISAVAMELRSVLTLAADGRWWPPASRVIGYTIGVLTTGMLLARLAAVALLAGDLRRTPLELALLALVLGPTLALAGAGGRRAVVVFAGLGVAGMAPGLLAVSPPLGEIVSIGSLLFFGAALATDRPIPARWVVPVASAAVFIVSWCVGRELLEYVSKSTGAAAGAVVAATCVVFASLAVSRLSASQTVPTGMRLVGGAVAAAAVLWRLADSHRWFENRVVTEAALGLLRIPVVSILLVAAAVLVWPRTTRILKQLGLEQKRRATHWLLLGAAFLLLPLGTIAVRNPLFEPHAPEGENARRVVTNVLSETYHAFNLADEDELYDTLERNVTEDLVDDLYLDSRRRLTAGTREGAEVTVRDVRVLEIGDPLDLAAPGQDFAYDVRWVVTARVRHLQHVHHRQNIYNGLLTLRPDGDRWKISGVELESEDRVVVPWKTT